MISASAPAVTAAAIGNVVMEYWTMSSTHAVNEATPACSSTVLEGSA